MTLRDDIRKHPALRGALESGRCVLFAGAGLSAGAGYPAYGALIDELVSAAKKLPHARIAGIEEFERDKDFITLAEFARSALGPNRFNAILTEAFGKRAAATPAHLAIARTKYRGVITTNYDRLIETVFTQVRGWPPNDFTPESVSALAGALSNPEPFVFKMHGNVSSPEGVVLSARDYDRVILRSPHVRSFLQAIFLTNSLLFVGYSIRDPNFRLVLTELNLIFEGFTPTHYALVPDASDFSVDDLLRRMNIQVIPYDPREGHVELSEALEELQRWAPVDIAK